jgi:dienelactone hydrolase
VTPTVGALPADPPRCGVPSYAWRHDVTLGDITGSGVHDHYTASASGVFLAIGKVKSTELVDVDVEQVAYMTQDRGKMIEATTLVAYPSDLDTRTQLEVVLVLHGTAGFTDSCAPSSSTDTRPLVAALASLGYVAVAPDYIGLRALNGKTGFLHPYLVGEATAIASLDAVRAATKLLASKNGNACAKPRFATIGGSQGGHAALWVDRLAPYYAKELEHVGVVATVPPADMVGEAVRALRTKVPASGNMAAFYGAASDWYGVRAKLNEVFVSPLDTEIPTKLGTSCSPELRDAELVDVFAKPLLDAAAGDNFAKLSPWGCMVAENGLTTTSVPRLAPTSPSYGIMFVLGEKDTLVDPETERKGFDTLCAQGMKMQYLECAGASHTQATTWALAEIIDFMRDRFAGKPMDAANVCKRAAATRCLGTP